ncbi:NAD(P)H-dependent oxidoreductase subunit E [candidate division KSB1 bacterium]|nr:NAD(P)H-dependent oxidoreductase subunit E [candidate division KSB1 bacterium]
MVNLDKTYKSQDVDAIVAEHGREPNAVIPILQAIQRIYRYLPKEALERVVETTEITAAAIEGVSTFYTMFRYEPVGEHTVHVCVGTACHVKGAERVYDAFLRELGIPQGKDTDKNRQFTVTKVACLGCCTLAPVVQIDQVTYGHVQPTDVDQILHDFFSLKKNSAASPQARQFDGNGNMGEVRIGLGSCCVASGSGLVKEALEKELSERQVPIQVKRVGCVGMCHQVPLLEILKPDQEPVLYARVQPDDVADIVNKHFPATNFRQRMQHSLTRWLDAIVADHSENGISRYTIHHRDEPVKSFLGRQRHIATEHGGAIDPTDLGEYQRLGGFTALHKCLTEMSYDDIIEHVKQSGLRGRGGAGFPTGVKWSLVRAETAQPKYIICNGDEGDPGAFMDRMLLESYPYRIIEGMIIAAIAVGAKQGYFYIRAEYPLAVKRVREAIAVCVQHGLLGEHILGTDFSFSLDAFEGAGAFVCGEETALIASMEGKRGMPRIRPPYPASQGLFGQPTLVNNAETYSLVPWIFRNGAEQFASLGTNHSKGTKVFALAGKVVRGGLIEVPMGITIREIVDDIGGGVQDGRTFKAVQVGGPSGGCIPASLAHFPVDFQALTNAGAMMGSGGLLIMDDSDCMVDIARYFLSFTQDQSCGKCTFCRVGTRRMLDIMDRLCTGTAKPDDIKTLETLAHQVMHGSLCALGKTAPNPVLTTLRYFRDEYEAHLEGRCPAKKCKALIKYNITDKCIGCTICAQKCPVNAIAFTPYQKHTIDAERCIRCDTCRQVCPEGAVEVI